MIQNGKKSALVTGGSKGIGAAIVKALAEIGYNIIIADIREPEYEMDFLVSKFNVDLYFVHTDISSKTSRESLVVECQNRYPSLELLVNNAGISVAKRGDMLEGTEASFDRLIEVNLKGPYFLTQLISKWMIESVTPRKDEFSPKIINLGSLTSYASSAYMAEYAISKSAVSMMTKLYADRLSSEGIQVFEVRPGIIKTGLTAPSSEKYDRFISEGGLPIARWGMPEDVGKVVAGIAQDFLPYSTGEVINVDGGFHLRRL